MTLRTEMDHLPWSIREELRRITTMLFEAFDETAKGRLSEQYRAGRILKLILHGPHSTQAWESVPPGEAFRLLVIVNYPRLARKERDWGLVRERLSRAWALGEITRPVRLTIESLERVNRALIEGVPHFVTIAADGIALYQSDGRCLQAPRILSAAERSARGIAEFARWHENGCDFLLGAAFYRHRDNGRMAALLLHQACEHFYLCVLWSITLHGPRSHALEELREAAEAVDVRLRTAWPREMPFARRAFGCIRRAYIEARYDRTYRISPQELDWAFARVRATGELGDDVTVRAERGDRQFAPGDRIMFLRNERSLGVKNGTLGEVELVTPSRMEVTLDGGRSVAFDVKDYADIDHGYAATVHKAQGMTVDRVHVLATPGLDRHAAYVAMSRHRDSVDLHYGRDDFADQGKLVCALSRERGKDMASDYRKPPEVERAAPSPPPRNRFAGLKLNAGPAPEPQRTPLDKAVERYARAAADVLRMRRAGLDELAHQKSAFVDAGKGLNAVRPDAARDLRAAFNAEPGLVDQAANGRTAAAIRAMTLEAEIRIDAAQQADRLAQRADRFVSDWQKGTRQLQALKHSGDYDAADRVRNSMGDMAKSLHRDPQLESLLRNRTKELGIGTLPGSSLSHELQHHPALSRGRGLGL